MEKLVKKSLICPCCGKEFVAEVLSGRYVREAMGLDTYPGREIFVKVLECPECGYAGFEFKGEVSDGIKAFVKDGKHRSQNAEDKIERKLTAAALIAEQSDDLRDAAYKHLILSWYLAEAGKDRRAALQKSAAFYAGYLKEHPDFDAAMTYIDIARQLGNFDEAKETAESLLSYAGDPLRKRLLDYELELIRNNDSDRHTIKGDD